MHPFAYVSLRQSPDPCGYWLMRSVSHPVVLPMITHPCSVMDDIDRKIDRYTNEWVNEWNKEEMDTPISVFRHWGGLANATHSYLRVERKVKFGWYVCERSGSSKQAEWTSASVCRQACMTAIIQIHPDRSLPLYIFLRLTDRSVHTRTTDSPTTTTTSTPEKTGMEDAAHISSYTCRDLFWCW